MSIQHTRFIHCADLHLDSRMETHLTPFQAQNRRKELLQTFFRLADYAQLHDVRAILISGDLFDTAYPASSALNDVLNCIQEHSKVDFLYLSGNHDHHIFSARSLNMSCPDNLWLFQSETNRFCGSSNSFWRHIITQKDYGEVTVTGLTEDAGQLPALYASRINLVMLHGQIYQHHASFENAGNDCLNYALPDFAGKNIDYIAAGHIHRYQSYPIDNRGFFCYSGCLEGRGFDECGEKGFVLLDIVSAEGNNSKAASASAITGEVEKPSISFQFIPFAARYFYDLDVDLTNCTDYQDAWKKIEPVFSAIDSPHLVRLKLTGRIPPELNLHVDWLLQKYLDDFYLLHIDDCTKPEISYEDYRYDFSLKGEFIRLVLSDSNLSDEEKEQVIMEGLHVLAGEEVLLG